MNQAHGSGMVVLGGGIHTMQMAYNNHAVTASSWGIGFLSRGCHTP